VSEQWIAFHRPGDGELTGYLEPRDDGSFVPLNLIGHPLGDPGSRAHAESVLGDRGLSSLANYWWCLAPRPLPTPAPGSDGVDLRDPEPEWEWRRMVIVDLDTLSCTVRPALPFPEEESVTAVITLPADDVLRVGPPHRD
jgi:hypothetical protein